jgi:hypothetical protein
MRSFVVLFVALVVLVAFALVAGCGGTKAPETRGVALSIEFADAAWKGGAVPYVGRCVQCSGSGVSPELIVRNVPKKAKALVIEFYNVTLKESGAVANHGAFRILLDGQPDIVVPSVPEQTMSMPVGVTVEKEHGSQYGRPGAYLAPCSCNSLDRYEVVVTTDKHEKWRDDGYEILAQGRLDMGYCCGD